MKVKELLQKENKVIGTKRTLKFTREGKVEYVILANNCPKEIINQFKYYEKLGGPKVILSQYNSKELGTLCGKPFKALVVGILYENKVGK